MCLPDAMERLLELGRWQTAGVASRSRVADPLTRLVTLPIITVVLVARLDRVHPHMLRAAFIMAALDAGVPLRDVQIVARHADPRTTTVYDRRRQNYDRHAAYAVVAFVTSG